MISWAWPKKVGDPALDWNLHLSRPKPRRHLKLRNLDWDRDSQNGLEMKTIYLFSILTQSRITRFGNAHLCILNTVYADWWYGGATAVLRKTSRRKCKLIRCLGNSNHSVWAVCFCLIDVLAIRCTACKINSRGNHLHWCLPQFALGSPFSKGNFINFCVRRSGV